MKEKTEKSSKEIFVYLLVAFYHIKCLENLYARFLAKNF